MGPQEAFGPIRAGTDTQPRAGQADLPLRIPGSDWAKKTKLRQLIVRATNPQERTIEAGVLTDDRQRAASEIIYLMFNRWTQENDFKHLDAHFGINQITSYASVAYERLKDQGQQKQVK
jgi:hypothetical protein